MKKILISPLTNTIYYATVKEQNNGSYIATGEKKDVTDDCIGAVFQWFQNNLKKDNAKSYKVTYEGSDYELVLIKKENK